MKVTRHITHRVLALLCCLLLSAAGCGSGSNDEFKKASQEPDAGTNPATPDTSGGETEEDTGGSAFYLPELDELYDGFESAACTKVFECCSDTEREVFQASGDSDQCEDNPQLMAPLVHQSLISSAIEAERIELDEDMAQLCMEQYQEVECGAWQTYRPLQAKLPGCEQMFVPLQDAGETCAADYECTTGACGAPSGPDELGECVEPLAEGASCDGQGPCGPGLHCAGFDLTCEPQLSDDTPCTSNSDCESGACVAGPEGNRRCGQEPPVCVGGTDSE